VSLRAAGEYVVAAGGFEPCTDNISKFFSDFERLSSYENVLDED
jgi:hypothetical protein